MSVPYPIHTTCEKHHFTRAANVCEGTCWLAGRGFRPQGLLRRFVDDCIAYLAGLVSTAEVLPVVRQQRDKMLTRVVIGALQNTLDALSVRDFSKAMQVLY